MTTPKKSVAEQIEEAFHYRGDVTIHLASGERFGGFLANRDTLGIEVLLPEGSAPRRVTLQNIVAVELSGEDCAAGNSYQEWLEKKKAEKDAAQG